MDTISAFRDAVTFTGAAATIWQRGGAAIFALSQATHALTLLMRLLDGPGCQVWVPAYFCENGLGPVRASRARLRLYPVTDAMTPDWDGCRAMLAQGAPSLFVLPHFFGVVNEVEVSRAFCDQVGALLLEDAAHVLRPVGAIGQFGDFVTYSPRKFLPIPDGGLLVVRDPAMAERIGRVAGSLPDEKLPLLAWRMLELRERVLPRREISGPMRPRRIEDEPQRVDELPAVWMSGFSRRRIERIGADGIAEIETEESTVADRIIEAMRSFPSLQPLPRHRGTAPYMLGFRASSETAAAEAFGALRRAGAIVETWPGLPPEVWAEPERYGETISIRRTVLRFLPRLTRRRKPLSFIDNLRLSSV